MCGCSQDLLRGAAGIASGAAEQAAVWAAAATEDANVARLDAEFLRSLRTLTSKCAARLHEGMRCRTPDYEH